MKGRLYIFLVFASLLSGCTSKAPLPVIPSKPGEDTSTEVRPDAASGISFSRDVLDADSPVTIFFKPTKTSSVSSALYDCTSDIYVHLGVYYDEEWTHVPAEWEENVEKCRMTKLEANSYKLEIGPTIREFFASGTTPVQMLAMVMRSADGSKQTTPDQFVSVTDKLYKDSGFTPGKIVEAKMPSGLRHGINYGSDGSVSLVLYDKSVSGKRHDYVCLIGDFNSWTRSSDYVMKWDSDAGCWWYTLTGMDPDKEYRFQYYIGDGASSFRIFDATSEVVYDPWNDKYISSSTYPDLPVYPSSTKDFVGAFQINRPSYEWKVSDFKIADENNIVIYELLLRDFTTSSDILGALSKLDYLKELGVGAIELMPVQEFDGNISWGYNPFAYFALDKAYGTRQMYKQFVDECHKRGMAVILDVVYNHTTGSHPFARLWWDAAKSNVSSENPLYNVTTPHGFGVFHDINHKASVMTDHIKRSLEYLLTEYHIDGFRFDLTKGFTNNSGKDAVYDAERVAILKDYGSFIKSVNPHAMVILEHFVEAENKALGESGLHVWGNNNSAYSAVVGGRNADLSYMYDPDCVRVGYMESHDEERICYGATASAEGVRWGICGTVNNWSAPDIAMTAEGGIFVARNVSFTSDDAFKIRGNGEWDDRYNYGAAVKNTVLPLGSAFDLTLGASSQDMKAPSSGAFDVWFSPDLCKVWMMTPGSAKPDVQVEVEDALSQAMQRASLAAAYTLLVPGPKMIWQFGEMGYDYSIEYGGGNTDPKPVRWDFLDDPARKSLHDTYAKLLKFRNENPEFFTKGATFRANVGTSDFEKGKFLFSEAGDKRFVVMGNFTTSSADVSVNLPFSAQWKDYASGEVLTSGARYVEKLSPGEFRVLVNF